jgi:hypothetical protein
VLNDTVWSENPPSQTNDPMKEVLGDGFAKDGDAKEIAG